MFSMISRFGLCFACQTSPAERLREPFVASSDLNEATWSQLPGLHAVTTLAFAPGGRFLAVGRAGGILMILDCTTHPLLARVHHMKLPTCVPSEQELPSWGEVGGPAIEAPPDEVLMKDDESSRASNDSEKSPSPAPSPRERHTHRALTAPGKLIATDIVCIAWASNCRVIFTGHRDGHLLAIEPSSGIVLDAVRLLRPLREIRPHPLSAGCLLVTFHEGMPGRLLWRSRRPPQPPAWDVIPSGAIPVASLRKQQAASRVLTCDCVWRCDGSRSDHRDDGNGGDDARRVGRLLESSVIVCASTRNDLTEVRSVDFHRLRSRPMGPATMPPTVREGPSDDLLLYCARPGVMFVSKSTLEAEDVVYSEPIEQTIMVDAAADPEGMQVIGIPSRRSGSLSGKLCLFDRGNAGSFRPLRPPVDAGAALSAKWQPDGRRMLVHTDLGTLWAVYHPLETHWPGPEYPPGFKRMLDNQEYLEEEDAVDAVNESGAVINPEALERVSDRFLEDGKRHPTLDELPKEIARGDAAGSVSAESSLEASGEGREDATVDIGVWPPPAPSARDLLRAALQLPSVAAVDTQRPLSLLPLAPRPVGLFAHCGTEGSAAIARWVRECVGGRGIQSHGAVSVASANTRADTLSDDGATVEDPSSPPASHAQSPSSDIDAAANTRAEESSATARARPAAPRSAIRFAESQASSLAEAIYEALRGKPAPHTASSSPQKRSPAVTSAASLPWKRPPPPRRLSGSAAGAPPPSKRPAIVPPAHLYHMRPPGVPSWPRPMLRTAVQSAPSASSSVSLGTAAAKATTAAAVTPTMPALTRGMPRGMSLSQLAPRGQPRTTMFHSNVPAGWIQAMIPAGPNQPPRVALVPASALASFRQTTVVTTGPSPTSARGQVPPATLAPSMATASMGRNKVAPLPSSTGPVASPSLVGARTAAVPPSTGAAVATAHSAAATQDTLEEGAKSSAREMNGATDSAATREREEAVDALARMASAPK